MSLFTDYDITVRQASLYDKWRRANPNESAAYDAYAASVKAGQPTAAPALATAFGRSLVLAGRMGAALLPPPPPPVHIAAASLIYAFGDKT